MMSQGVKVQLAEVQVVITKKGEKDGGRGVCKKGGGRRYGGNNYMAQLVKHGPPPNNFVASGITISYISF
jgi:hypothetical protein